jgi:hypothetical protein
MSDCTILLGKAPVRDTDISQAVRDIGVNLIRAEPQEVKPTVTVEYKNPSYDIYKSHFSLYVAKNYARDSVRSTSDSPYVGMPSQSIIPILPLFGVVFHFNHAPVPEDLEDLIQTIPSLEQLTIRKKASFLLPNVDIADLSLIRQIMQRGPDITTPTIAGCVNLSGLQTLLMLLRIANVTLRTNQYPLWETPLDVENTMIAGYYQKSVYLDHAAAADVREADFDIGDGNEVR